MFKNKEKAQALLFEFTKKGPAIHSCFVLFPFYAIWLDKKDSILEIKRVEPFTPHIKPKKNYSKLIEIPINKKYKKIIKILES
jgi:uncharacterized membrane protein (UPF0127 family)